MTASPPMFDDVTAAPAPPPTPPFGPPAGYFGKVPSHGDFVARRVERAVREPFDAWLSAGMRASRARLGEGWLSAYLVAPIWRFAASAGVCGPDALVGVMMPGVDRVGRYFPLVLAAALPGHQGGVSWLCRHRDWFEEAERLVAATLRDDFRLADFDAAVARIHAPAPNPDAARDIKPHSMWWTTGSDTVAPLATACVGLPDPDDFHVWLTGDATGTRLRTTTFTPATLTPGAAAEATAGAPTPQRAVPVCRAATLTHPGPTHAGAAGRANTDVVHVSARGDVFALAAGTAAQDAGSAARAAAACGAALASVGEAPSLNDLLAEVKGKLGQAHSRVRAAGEAGVSAGSGAMSSVAALVTQGDRYAVAWVGDARVYLREGGMLRLVTRDHVEIGLERRLSRAVGGPSPLAVQTLMGTLHAGDRFVICSGPLARALDDRTVAGATVEGEGGASARRLIEEALIAGSGGAFGSLTALVVDVEAAERPAGTRQAASREPSASPEPLVAAEPSVAPERSVAAGPSAPEPPAAQARMRSEPATLVP